MELTQFLVEYGADAVIQDKRGMTPLHGLPRGVTWSWPSSSSSTALMRRPRTTMGRRR